MLTSHTALEYVVWEYIGPSTVTVRVAQTAILASVGAIAYYRLYPVSH
jgi:hypothetical protein